MTIEFSWSEVDDDGEPLSEVNVLQWLCEAERTIENATTGPMAPYMMLMRAATQMGFYNVKAASREGRLQDVWTLAIKLEGERAVVVEAEPEPKQLAKGKP